MGILAFLILGLIAGAKSTRSPVSTFRMRRPQSIRTTEPATVRGDGSVHPGMGDEPLLDTEGFREGIESLQSQPKTRAGWAIPSCPPLAPRPQREAVGDGEDVSLFSDSVAAELRFGRIL
jgi:hypothetical protein